MQIEAGKFYTTRDGRKIGPMVSRVHAPWVRPYFGSGDLGSGGLWFEDGSAYYEDATDSPILIAEWVEPVADRKPKVGDKVVILPGAFGTARSYIGETVEIVAVEKRSFGSGLVLRFGDGWPPIDGEWEFARAGFFPRPTTNPDATSVPGDIVEVVADRYDAVPVGSLGRITASVTSGRHVRMCDDGLSYVFALDEIAKTDTQPVYEYAAGDASEFGPGLDDFDCCMDVADAYESDLRDDIAAETLALIIENEGADIRTATKHAETAFAYADAFIAARAA